MCPFRRTDSLKQIKLKEVTHQIVKDRFLSYSRHLDLLPAGWQTEVKKTRNATVAPLDRALRQGQRRLVILAAFGKLSTATTGEKENFCRLSAGLLPGAPETPQRIRLGNMCGHGVGVAGQEVPMMLNISDLTG
jgi:hypothetical protein